MHDADLPLFNWQPPVKVLVFPLINRVGKVRKTAAILSRKHGEDAILYWKQVNTPLRGYLRIAPASSAPRASAQQSKRRCVAQESARTKCG